jgi:hypothetical protein
MRNEIKRFPGRSHREIALLQAISIRGCRRYRTALMYGEEPVFLVEHFWCESFPAMKEQGERVLIVMPKGNTVLRKNPGENESIVSSTVSSARK